MENMIMVRDLQKNFPIGGGQEFPALQGVDMDIPAGKLTILKGRSGSGKTTLLNILSALDEPSGGEIVFGGQNMKELSDNDKEKLRRYQIGFVFQSVALIPIMSAYENVDFSLRLAEYEGSRDKRIREVIKLVGLLKRMNHMPNQLSGGEQQRIAIARAVAHKPKVIFADEPTGALDTTSGLTVVKLFRNLVATEGITVVITTHDPGLMEFGDLVYEMEDGRIISREEHDYEDEIKNEIRKEVEEKRKKY